MILKHACKHQRTAQDRPRYVFAVAAHTHHFEIFTVNRVEELEWCEKEQCALENKATEENQDCPSLIEW